MAAAVYARSAFEWKLRNVCEDRGIEIKFKKDHKKITADALWQGVVARQRAREELRNTQPTVVDFVSPQLVKEVDAMRSTVLNQLSHAEPPDLKPADVRDALKTVEALHKHDFPEGLVA
jgi:hypothetical protein